MRASCLALALLLFLPACDGRSLATTGELCHNGLDDDGDGRVDCADPDCTSSSACLYPVCGDGVVEGAEECEGNDVGGTTCAEVRPGTSGVLACDAQCRFDPSGCSGGGDCGNGVVEPGEECDCGRSASDLPAGCTNINGGVGGACAADCTGAHCGNGVVEPGEECDDGNTIPGDGCGATCQLDEVCTHPRVWDECDPLAVDACCPDEWGVALECSTVAQTPMCQRFCSTTDDCYWSQRCYTAANICWLAYCGPDSDEYDTYCQVPGGGEGWCAPFFEIGDPSDERYGMCVEAGTLRHGEPCTTSAELAIDRSEDHCAYGWCVANQGAAVGHCMQFCNWAQAHDHAAYGANAPELPCPAGTNCLAQAFVDPDAGGALQMGTTICMGTPQTNPANGVDTCSLITNQLLRDPARTCADVEPDGQCRIVMWTAGAGADGTLVGVCAPSNAPNRDVWEACDPDNSNHICPAGTRCSEEDSLSANPSGPTRCVPLCDTAEHGGSGGCAALGAVSGAVCTSMSAPYSLPAAADRSRLGYCVVPPAP